MSGEQEKIRLSIKQFVIIFFLGLGYTVVYATPFVQYVFYDALVSALGCSQQELGYLITISHYDFWRREYFSCFWRDAERPV